MEILGLMTYMCLTHQALFGVNQRSEDKNRQQGHVIQCRELVESYICLEAMMEKNVSMKLIFWIWIQ